MRIARAWLRSLRDPAARRELDARLGWYILLGTIPIGIFGLAFKDQIETGARDLYVIGVGADRARPGAARRGAVRHARPRRRADHPRATASAMGLAQALALIPGVSRSGATITAGLFLGLDRHRRGALLVPALDPGRGAERGCSSSVDRRGEEGEHMGAGALAVATLLAFVSGYASIAFLLRWLDQPLD